MSHILLGTENRGEAEAQELAASLREQLEADPTRFDAFVMEYSDDPVKENNDGRYAEMRRGMMVRSFEKAAFALEQPGQISRAGQDRVRLSHHSPQRPIRRRVAGVQRGQGAGGGRARQRYLDSYRAELPDQDPVRPGGDTGWRG